MGRVKSPTAKEQLNKIVEDTVNSTTDLYRVAARVKNLARMQDGGIGTLTPVGDQLCNLHVHMLMDLYAYAETLPSPYSEELTERIRTHEGVPHKLLSLQRKK